MPHEINDEQLIAYVLGELEAAERATVERALVSDTALQQNVAKIRHTVNLSIHAVQQEPATSLSVTQREAIASEAQSAAIRSDKRNVSAGGSVRRRLPGRLSWLPRAAVIFLMLAGVAIIAIPNLTVYRAKFVNDTADLDGNIISALRSEESSQTAPSVQQPVASSGELVQHEVDRLNRPDDAKQIGRASSTGARHADRKPNPALPPSKQPTGPERKLGKNEVSPSAPVEEPRQTVGQFKTDTQFAARGLRSGKPLERRTHRDELIPSDTPGHNTETYDAVRDNAFLKVTQHPLSTFSIDVDTASYANIRRFLRHNQLPPKDAVRIEEMINYFSYDYQAPQGEDAFSVQVEVADAPWHPEHRLARIGLKGREMDASQRPASNLVFLLDVSGSMRAANKLPLLKSAITMLINHLDERDVVTIVVYAGASGLVLPPTPGDDKVAILNALQQLRSGGSTNGGAGIQLAYEQAAANFIEGGVNRVILATDGDFNVGLTHRGGLVRLLEEKAQSGVFLTVLGFGMGNIKDATLEELSGKGNGNYAYIDTIEEARKVLVQEMGGTLVTIAKDVKLQVEFNPAEVAAYRLIGYENRLMAAQDFNDDRKDAGDIGAGHTVTALYELIPPGEPVDLPSVDALKYQQPAMQTVPSPSGELFTLKLRYKQPDGDTSTRLVFPVTDGGRSYAAASSDFKFAAAVASFGMLLRDSAHKGRTTFDSVLELAAEGLGQDRHGYRRAFLDLVRQAKAIAGVPPRPSP